MSSVQLNTISWVRLPDGAKAYAVARAQVNECIGISIGTAAEHLFAFLFKPIPQDINVYAGDGPFGLLVARNPKSYMIVIDVLLVLLVLPVWRIIIVEIFLAHDEEHDEWVAEYVINHPDANKSLGAKKDKDWGMRRMD